MHYFYNLSSASTPDPHSWTPLGDFRPQTLNLPAFGKNPVGAHGETVLRFYSSRFLRLLTFVFL